MLHAWTEWSIEIDAGRTQASFSNVCLCLKYLLYIIYIHTCIMIMHADLLLLAYLVLHNPSVDCRN